jgi:uncharacterized membrane protein
VTALLRPRVGPRSLVLPLISLGLLVAVLLLPDLSPRTSAPAPVTAYHARIVALLPAHRPNPSDPASGFLPDSRVLMLEGPQAGSEVEAYLEGPGGQEVATGYRAGDEVVVTSTATPDGPPFLAVSDHWRLPQLAWLAILFGVAVVVVGGWRGLRALLALGLTMAIVIRVLVPLLLQGVPPIPMAVLIATAITILTIGLTEGFARASVAAILGTTAALGLTALLAAVTTVLAGFTNAAGTDLAFLATGDGNGLDLRGLLLAAFILGAIGVLDDVTVTQAVAVDELVAQGGLRGRRLYASAFNVGRSHIAATVNTLFLAYAGASLPLLVLFAVSHQPTALVLNGEVVSVEIVRTLVGSLGIVAAVPLTTAIAVWLATPRGPLVADDAINRRERGGLAALLRRPLVALVTGLTAIGLLVGVATAALGPIIGTGPGAPLTPTVLIPTPSPSAAASDEPAPSDNGPGPGETLVPVIDVGEVQGVIDPTGGTAAVSIVERRVPAVTTGPQLVDVLVRYQAQSIFTVRVEAWVALTSDGDEVRAKPGDGPAPHLVDETLAGGTTREAWLEFSLPSRGDSLFLDYRDRDGTPLFSVQVY